MKFLLSLLLGSICLLPLAADAQWQWIDKNGKKVFSDQPPPTDIPEKNIVRRAGPPARTGSGVAAPEGTATTDKGAEAPVAPGAPKAPTVDKDLEEKTKKAEADEKAKQAAEAAKLAKAKAENCSRARESKATMDSGMRIARVNAKGEREILDDNQRVAEQRRLQSVIDSDCK